ATTRARRTFRALQTSRTPSTTESESLRSSSPGCVRAGADNGKSAMPVSVHPLRRWRRMTPFTALEPISSPTVGARRRRGSRIRPRLPQVECQDHKAVLCFRYTSPLVSLLARGHPSRSTVWKVERQNCNRPIFTLKDSGLLGAVDNRLNGRYLNGLQFCRSA